MHKLICIRPGPSCRPGQWFICEEIGGDCWRAHVIRKPEGFVLRQGSRVAIPFASIAEYVVEPGFQIPQRLLMMLSRGKTNAATAAREIADFQRSVEDIVEPEAEARGVEANPSLDRASTIVVPKDYKETPNADSTDGRTREAD